jgi:hypothetical protein
VPRVRDGVRLGRRVRVLAPVEVKVRVRPPVVRVRVHVNVSAPSQQKVEDARAKEDNHQRDGEFERDTQRLRHGHAQEDEEAPGGQ